MIVLNFSHPLTDEQRTQLESITEQSLEIPIRRQASFDNDRDFGPQIAELADSCELDGDAWQTEPILIVPPALNAIAVLLLAELHGRMGYFPPCVRLRRVEDSVPTQYEVAEVLDLQRQREAARRARQNKEVT